MSDLELYVLGPPRLARDSQPRDLPPAKAVALLAYLALSRTPPSREAIQALLWPESFADAARKNLRNTLWALRKALGDDVLQADDDRLALREGVYVDVRHFEALAAGGAGAPIERLEEAAALYGGPLLDGVSPGEAPDFEFWLTTERERLEQIYLRALDALVAAQRAAGRWPEMIVAARRALARDPLQEPMHRTLMEAHARLGERPEALRQYDTLRATLSREIGVEPLPETEALRTAILSGDLGPRPAAPPARPRRAVVPQATPYVGRQTERATLDAEREASTQGQARVVLLTGEVGIGKSRLWQEWAATQPAGLILLETRCLESTQALPFAPLITLFDSPPCTGAVFGPNSPISPIWLAELARLFPDLRRTRPDLPAPAVLPAEEERRRVFEAFTQCIQAIDSPSLVLFIDDMHWADHATLDWIDYLVHRLPDHRLLVVLAYRPEDAPAGLVHLVAGWGREGLARRIALSRLTAAESAQLLAAVGGDLALAARLQAQGAGNPYFLIELIRAAPADVPPVLVELIRARLARLGDSALGVVQAAAVLEPDIDFPTLRRTSGRSEEETLDALDILLDRALLVERKVHYEFAHPLIATVVRDELSAARRAFLHRRAAEAREAMHSGPLALIAGRLAAHYNAAGDAARAAYYADLAAEHALALAALDEAIAFYRQALVLAKTPARHLGLAGALYLWGDLAGARLAYATAFESFRAAGDRRGAVRACLGQAETYIPSGQAEEISTWVRRGLEYLDADTDPEAHAHAHFLLGAGRVVAETALDEAEGHLNEAAQLATANHLLRIATASRFELGTLLALRGDLPGALAAYRESIAQARQAGDPFQEVLGHNNAAYHSILAGDLPAAREHITAALAIAESGALRLPLQYLYSTRGELALAEGDPADAETWFTRGLAEAERAGNRKQAANYQANLGLAARARGDLDTALLQLEAARTGAARLTAPHLQTQIDLWLTELYRARGERAAAAGALARAEARLTDGTRAGLRAWATRLRDSTP